MDFLEKAGRKIGRYFDKAYDCLSRATERIVKAHPIYRKDTKELQETLELLGEELSLVRCVDETRRHQLEMQGSQLSRLLQAYESLQTSYSQLETELEKSRVYSADLEVQLQESSVLTEKAHSREKRVRDLERVCRWRRETILSYKREDVKRRIGTLKATNSPFVYLNQRGIVEDVSDEALKLLKTTRKVIINKHYSYFLQIGADFVETRRLKKEFVAGEGSEEKIRVNIKAEGKIVKVNTEITPAYELTIAGKNRLAGTIIKFMVEDEARETFWRTVRNLLFGTGETAIEPSQSSAS